MRDLGEKGLSKCLIETVPFTLKPKGKHSPCSFFLRASTEGCDWLLCVFSGAPATTGLLWHTQHPKFSQSWVDLLTRILHHASRMLWHPPSVSFGLFNSYFLLLPIFPRKEVQGLYHERNFVANLSLGFFMYTSPHPLALARNERFSRPALPRFSISPEHPFVFRRVRKDLYVGSH